MITIYKTLSSCQYITTETSIFEMEVKGQWMRLRLTESSSEMGFSIIAQARDEDRVSEINPIAKKRC